MNQDQLSRIVLKGFKSIRECDLELKELNVLIGANGSGKSNFITIFRMIQQILARNLQLYVSKQGGPDSLLYFGRKKTP
nr:AAA family ATPase [Pseudanabaena mucicola]